MNFSHGGVVVTVESNLVSGRDYPNTYREFVEMFPDNVACAAFLVRLRWSEEFTCSACKTASAAWNESRNRLECPICHHQTYLTAGTIFDKTRTPLITWLEAAWHLTTAKNGMSAKTLERTLGISYRTAWMMLQRFRVAMVNKERKQLSGEVEIGETLVGGVPQGGKRGRGSSKSVVVTAVEIKQPKDFGRMEQL
jgi:transposase-like protein